MAERDPNSRRYWRLNTIMALRETRASEAEARDPDHLAAIRADRVESDRLEARERAVRARHARRCPPTP